MHELPESRVLAKQLSQTVLKKKITHAVAASSPHGFAWYHGDPAEYSELLVGKSFTAANAFGSYVELSGKGVSLALSEGATIRHLAKGAKRPPKHQLYLEFADGTGLYSTIQMYGGIFAFALGKYANDYYHISKNALPYDDDAFDLAYLKSLLPEKKASLSVKAFLATEQRIPGLGNGVLHDILFSCGLHPKRKIHTLSSDDWQRMYNSIRETLQEMEEQGGRNVEKDLFGNSGGYVTILSAKTVGTPCFKCGTIIKREAYLGGNIYYCPECQK